LSSTKATQQSTQFNIYAMLSSIASGTLFLALVSTVSSYHGHDYIPDIPPTDKCYYGQYEFSWHESGANDVVVVLQPDGSMMATQFNVKLPQHRGWGPRQLYVNGRPVPMDSHMDVTTNGNIFFRRNPYSCTFTNRELQSMFLHPGRNSGILKVMKPYREMWLRDVSVPFNIFLYNETSRFVAMDIDSPTTRKDNGYLIPEYNLNEEHAGAIELMDKVYKNGYVPIYLTARPFTKSEDIRFYMFERLQDIRDFSLPETPIFMAPRAYPDNIANIFKTASLLSMTQLYQRWEKDVFMGAYGQMELDTNVFYDAGIDRNSTYLEDRHNRLYNMEDKKETTFQDQCENVDTMYPKVPVDHLSLIYLNDQTESKSP